MGIFKIRPPRQLPVLCRVVFILRAVWSLFRQRFFLLFWDFFSFLFSFPILKRVQLAGLSCLGVSSAGVCQSPWAMLLQQASPNRSAACSRREDYRSRASLFLAALASQPQPSINTELCNQKLFQSEFANSAGSKKGHPMLAPADWSFSPHPTAASAEHSSRSRACKQQEEAEDRSHRNWQVFVCCYNCSVKFLPSQKGCDSILSLCPRSLRLSLPCAISGKAISSILGLSLFQWGCEFFAVWYLEIIDLFFLACWHSVCQ